MPSMSELTSADFDSDYLCKSCCSPLYQMFSSEIDACLNPDCADWPTKYSSIVNSDEQSSRRTYQELARQKDQILGKIKSCNLSSIRSFAHEERKRLSQGFLETRAMRISDWQAVSELLLIAQSEILSDCREDGVEDPEFFRAILVETSLWSQRMLNLEDLQTGRYRMLKTKDGNFDRSAFALKFLTALRDNEESLGFTKKLPKIDDGSLFKYGHIESASALMLPSDNADLGAFLETLWPLTLTFRHALRSHSRTTTMYKYQPNLAGLSVLAGYFLGCDGGTCRIPAEKVAAEKSQMNENLLKISAGSVTAQDFVMKYVYCEDQPPVIVETSDGWLVDRATLLLYLLFLQGEPGLAGNSTPSLEEPMLDKMRGRAGLQFERWIRAELKNLDYVGPDGPIQSKYEYDIMSLSESKKLIILAEAKFRDINPSSVTGINMISHEFLSEDSVFSQAQRQQERLSFFLEHKERFEQFLGPRNIWESFEVKSYLVTKSQPVISRFENTQVLMASDFLKSVSLLS